MSRRFLPESTCQVIDRVPVPQRHPGLQLDKLSIPGDQTAQKRALEEVCKTVGDLSLLQAATARRQSLLGSLPGCCVFQATTVSPLSLHLARASALENAGLCLHPLYGFAYIPGSGLKGMARAYAETVWLPTQPDKQQAWRYIEDVFGWAPHPDRRQQISNPDHPAEPRRTDDHDPDSPEIKASSGHMVFHDAWPETWPKLVVDIVNNHHPDYYQADPNDTAHPPGDWENPVPVYFLAVTPGTTFTFVLTKRRADVPGHLVELAQEWLTGALCHLGAGAKTNAGYGGFKPVEPPCSALPPEPRATFETTLELVTPAFLAGASQQADDCDLRPATLRGLLRWWWRTMHAGFMDVKTLRALEAALWGDTKGSGAVRILLEPIDRARPQPYDKRSKVAAHDGHKTSDYGIPSERDARRITPGLWYLSYGMDETNRRRHYLEPATRWRLRMCARPTRFFANRTDASDPKKIDHGREITAVQALHQAQAALWLLCYFGGIGSKARKGFGSLSTNSLPNDVVDVCKRSAHQLRQQLQLPNKFDEHRAESPSLERILGPEEIAFGWPNVWNVLDQVGYAYQTFAKKYKHNRAKLALGLPRRLGPNVRGQFHPTPPVTPSGRHASPVHIHLQREGNGYLVRVVAFPAAHLPDLQTSRAFLQAFLQDFETDLHRRASLRPPSAPPSQAIGSPRQRAMSSSTEVSLPRSGERVEAVLLEERTKKGGWKARHVASGISGPIVNSAEVPAGQNAGDTVTLIVHSASQREISFYWPTIADGSKAKQPGGQKPSKRDKR